jgi:serine protease AprX
MGSNRGRWSRRLAGVALSASQLLISSCARLQPPERYAREDPYDLVYTVRDSSGVFLRAVHPLQASAYMPRFFFQDHLARSRRFPPLEKIHPTLSQWILHRPPSDVVEVMVSFVDTVRIPRFPVPDVTLGRGGAFNKATMDTARSLIDSLVVHRAAQYSADTVDIKTNFGGTIRETFWLSQAALIEIRLDQVVPLSARPGVIFIGPNAGASPPQSLSDVSVARGQIGSDAFAAASDNWIALLDSGVETTHRLLVDPSASPPTHLCAVVNCVPDDPKVPLVTECSEFKADGSTPDGGDVDDVNEGHGTSSAAILVGNGRDIPAGAGNGANYRGVTTATLDSYRVYDQPLAPGKRAELNHAAASRAIQFALARASMIIVAEMQDTVMSTDLADLTRFADHAYEIGRPVIAANGNDDDWGPGIPARGRLVIGVGSYHVQVIPPVVESMRARGPTPDGRLKPDLIAPTETETAAKRLVSGVLDVSAKHSYGGTSGATPYAAAAASLLQRWMQPATDAGQVYSHLILAGNQVGPFKRDSDTGVGAIRLQHPALTTYGKVWVSSAVRHITLPIPYWIDPQVLLGSHLAAALWWPEVGRVEKGQPVDTHNDIDLEIIKTGPFGWGGHVVAISDGADGVFERADATLGPLPGILGYWYIGPWKLRIRPKVMRTKPQCVYWAAALHS